MSKIELLHGIVFIDQPRKDGHLHGPTLTIDAESADGVGTIVRIVSEDERPFPHGVEVPVKYGIIGDEAIKPDQRLDLYVGSRHFGHLLT